MTIGYYRFPTINADTIVFVAEDDLWAVSVHGGVARRFTSNLGDVTHPVFSADGTWLAFVGKEEGTSEVYVMPADGGSARRLTFLGSNCRVLGWTADGTQIIFMSNYGQAMASEYSLFTVPLEGVPGEVTPLPYGLAQSISFGPQGGVVIGRNMGNDPARWKRYRGGTAGHLWIDRTGDGQFERFLSDLPGNIASPMWIATDGSEGRIFFASDHEGIGNLYSVNPDGSDLKRHTDHEDYYVRNPTTDGRRIVYHAGADLYVYEVVTDQSTRVEIQYRSPRIQRNRRFVDAARFLNSAALHPNGRALTITSRGKFFAFYNHDGPVLQLGKRDGVRYRLADWLCDHRHLVVISDELGEETLEIHTTNVDDAPRRLDGLDLGRAIALKPSPVQEKVAITNHRHELLIVDLPTATVTLVARSPYRSIGGFDWSPDGRWLAYSYAVTSKTSEIRLYRLADPEATDPALQESSIHTVTRPILYDVQPSFDPEGKYLYFLSYREFNPVADGLHFDLGFPWGMRPYLITLRADIPHPFVPHPELEEDEPPRQLAGDTPIPPESPDGEADDRPEEEDNEDDGTAEESGDDAAPEASETAHTPSNEGEGEPALVSPESPDAPSSSEQSKLPPHARNSAPVLRIDLEGIEKRILAFPVADGRFGKIMGIPGKAIFTQFPLQGALENGDHWENEGPESGTLYAYSFRDYKLEVVTDNVSWFDLSRNRKKLLYASGRRLRVINAGEKPSNEGGHPRRTGWIDLSRVKVSVNPPSEWAQMFREAWRLQRDHFWTEDMSGVDWRTVYDRYFPLIERVSTRNEFSDLMWEMQGELGTSHAYEMGGDYRWPPYYNQGFLGAQLHWNAEAGGYQVGEVIEGDPWNPYATSPLRGPGIDVQPGDVLVAVNGQPVDAELSPAQLLVNQAGQEVLLTFAPRPPKEATAPVKQPNRNLVVRTLHSERATRYRAWVEANRRRVHEATQGRVGYVHIPDMGARGYAEFHRGYLAEVDRDGLIIDVRYNGGGHVSQLILEKLARRRIGYDYSRWGGQMPYPVDSVAGPLVALTNEHAGSDGDIFCHSFKLLRLGPLIGKRTWGGVVGISPRHSLVDGTMTTQPEYSFWFEDVGWNVENYGTEPDIEVDITPQDYRAGRDPQLERALQEILRLLAEKPVGRPDLSQRPSRALPKLPPRVLE